MSSSMIRVSYHEAQAILLMKFEDGDSTETRIIKRVMRAVWSFSIPAEQIAAIGSAIYGMNIEAASLQPWLELLIRNKALRSRVVGGRRLYEINY